MPSDGTNKIYHGFTTDFKSLNNPAARSWAQWYFK